MRVQPGSREKMGVPARGTPKSREEGLLPNGFAVESEVQPVDLGFKARAEHKVDDEDNDQAGHFVVGDENAEALQLSRVLTLLLRRPCRFRRGPNRAVGPRRSRIVPAPRAEPDGGMAHDSGIANTRIQPLTTKHVQKLGRN